MNFLSKLKIKKIFSVFLCLNLIFYSTVVPAVQYYSYASENCDPEDKDYQECLDEEERERQEEEEEDRQKAEKEKAEQEREEKEAIIEEHEDDPNWIAPWLVTPTPTPTQVSIPNTPNAQNSQTGEGSTNEASSNSASEIDIENINTTTLEEEVNVVSNTGNNTICQDCLPGTLSEDIINNEEDDDLTDEILLPEEITQESLSDDSNEDDDSEDESSQDEEGQGAEAVEVESEGESFTESEEEGISQESINGKAEDDFTTDASGENFSSGEDANQMAVSENIDEVTVHNENDLELVNEMEVSSTSGENELSENEDNADLGTGAGGSSATLGNAGNVNVTKVGESDGAEAVNENTGDDSTNFTSDEVSQTLTVENKNQAAVENNLSVSSTSGKNELSDNEGDATLTTDEVEIIANLLNILNLNITGYDFTHLIINIFGNLTGEFDLDDIAEEYLGIDEDELVAIAKNSDTGENSENTAIAKNSETLDVTNENEAAVINNVEVEGITGQNELSENEDNVTVLTGRIKILTSILNFINANFSGTDWYFAMINIFGSLTGDILLPDPDQFLYAQNGGVEAGNSETGDDSQNQALGSETEQINVTNDNAAEVRNTINVTGDSGTNQALANEDETEMETGEVNVAANIMNWLDYNIFGNRWVMVVVNVFGRWMGRVIAFPGKGDIDAPESGTLVAVASGEDDSGPTVQAGNEQTGDDSDNFAEGSSETNWEVDNQNKAYVENNVEVAGISGQNETNQNEDQVNIVTGWIDIGVNLFNLVNFNVAGRQWMLLIVNVFGDFFGDIVFPHQEPEVLPEVLADSTLSDADEFGFEAEDVSGSESDNEEESFGDEETSSDAEENSSDEGEAQGEKAVPDDEEVSGDEEGLGDEEGFEEEGQKEDSSSTDNVSNDDWGDDVIITGGQSSGDPGNLIRKNLRTFVFAGAKVNSQTSDDEEVLDISSNNDYNPKSVDEDSTYRTNPVHISFWKIIENLTALLKGFLAHILPTH